MDIKEGIQVVVDGYDLAQGDAADVMRSIMTGEATPAQVGSFITALRMKGETIEEVVGAAKVMRAHATPIRVGGVVDLDRDEINLDRETILDTCGTGGSGTKSFNISTTVAIAVTTLFLVVGLVIFLVLLAVQFIVSGLTDTWRVVAAAQ